MTATVARSARAVDELRLGADEAIARFERDGDPFAAVLSTRQHLPPR